MALVVTSSGHNLSFSSGNQEWSQEHSAYFNERPQELIIIVKDSSFDSPSEHCSQLQQLQASVSTPDIVTNSASVLYDHFLGCECSDLKTNGLNCACCLVQSNANTGTRNSDHNSASQASNTDDTPHEQITMEHCILSAVSTTIDDKPTATFNGSDSKISQSNCEETDCHDSDVGLHRSTRIKKRKRLKKMRQKSLGKWKPLDCNELGFEFLLMPVFFNEDTCFEEEDIDENMSDVQEATTSKLAPLEESGRGAADNIQTTSTINEKEQSDEDNVAFFQALGIDVLNFNDDECDDITDWDGVYFSPTVCTSSLPRQNANSDKVKDRPRKNPKLTEKVHSDTKKHAQLKSSTTTNTENIPVLPSPSVGFSRLVKSDRFKLFELECSSSKRIFIRRDRDRRKQKAHKAVKSKNCRSVLNNKGRKLLYMHHRLIKMHNMNLDFRGSVKSYGIPPITKTNIALDVAKEVVRADRKRDNPKPAPVQNLNHALHETNCNTHLESELAVFLISLQHRDLTPEDYDMLLRLDDTVKPKTVSACVLEKLKTEVIGPNGPEAGAGDWEPMCTICMELYITGQERKFLPCGHDFHTPCIDKWLTNSSLNCPLDGLPIESS